MSEVIYVCKCLVVTILIVLLSQVKIGGITVEDRVDDGLRNSKVAVWVQSAAAGGALAITNAARLVKESIAGDFRDERTTRAERAGR